MRAADSQPEHLDVLIVGAGLSGIGAAWHLQDKQPGKRYAILEARDAIGGTWDLFRYPGIRSDSDLHTFGYAFRPWPGRKAIADGPAIRAYIRETAVEHGIDRRIRFGHRAVRAEWSSDEARWTVEAENVHTGERVALTSRWLFCASGYYRYDEGYTPRLPGIERFGGPVVHPQHWPEELEHAGKRVVIVGSGATAVTLAPAMAQDAAHVTILQRSPTYVLPVPSEDRVANRLRALLGDERAYWLTRRKNILQQQAVYRFCRRYPDRARRLIRWVNAKQLAGTGCDVDVHFRPRYGPWDQRLCAVPDADLYKAIRAGAVSMATDQIETLTETGIRLRSGGALEADVVITATGLQILPFGGVEMRVDGRKVSLPDTVAYKGLMLSGVPNFVFAIGYTNAAWTLKVDLVCEYFCRLIAHTERHGHDACVPEVTDPAMPLQPLLDFKANYVLRTLDQLPRQGERAPWFLAMSFFKDSRYLRHGRVDDAPMRFYSALRAASAGDLAVAA